MSSWGNNDNAANAPYWAVNSTILNAADVKAVASAPTAANVALLYGNTTPHVYTTNATIGLFLVNAAEMSAGSDNVTAVSVSTGGSRYLEGANVTFSGGGGSGAAATATISGGAVTSIAVTNTGLSYTSVPTVTVAKPKRNIPTAGVTIATEQIAYTTHGLVAAEEVKYYNGGGASITGLVDGTSYYVSSIGLAAGTFRLAASAGAAAGRTALAGIAIAGTGGEFTCTATTLAAGDHIVIGGTVTGTGSITSHTAGKIYEVSAVTGTSPNVTGFTITQEDGTAVVSTAGNGTGLTLTPYTIVMISGTGNAQQYFEIQATADQATAIADLGSGAGGTQATQPGWVLRTVGTGGRAGRVQYETLVALANPIGDGSDDITLPDN
jgi:hypothetical protein